MFPGADSSLVARAHGVTKAFGGAYALRGVDLELRRGEIHALIGGNGSGKSTLIKVLAGVHNAEAGSLETTTGSHELSRSTPATARAAGFHFVHQEHTTFPELTVAENLAIGRGFDTGMAFRIRRRRSERRAQAALDRFGVAVDPAADVVSLGPVDRTMVEIVRALQDQDDAHSGILVLDEPTAALPQPEVDELLGSLRRYAALGQTILMVTHRLEEVLAIADRISVFRDGLRVTTVARNEVDHERLVELMVGTSPATGGAPTAPPGAPSGTAPILDMRGLQGGPVRGVDLQVRSGEIVGLTGLAGSGTTELLSLLFGALPITNGELYVDGDRIDRWNRRTAMQAGIALVPADRRHKGILPELSVTENLSAATVSRYWSGWRLSESRMRTDAEADVVRYGIRTASLSQPVSALSGGNQQKVMLARWLRRQPRLLLLDEPTQGVDVGARREIWSVVRSVVDAGAAALTASSDVEDLIGVCDRILVIRDGRVAHELCDQPLDTNRITQLLHGTT